MAAGPAARAVINADQALSTKQRQAEGSGQSGPSALVAFQPEKSAFSVAAIAAACFDGLEPLV